jgi:phytoene dehydrogenase-like protein
MIHSPEMVPEGHHALTVYTICPDTLNEGNWVDRREKIAVKLVAYAEKYIPCLSEHTLTWEITSLRRILEN